MKVDVVFEAGKWYATVCYKVDRPPGPEPDMVAAMNRNCGQVVVVYSDGNPRYTGKPQPKVEHTGLKRAQRKQARLKKVSNHRHRTKLRIGKPCPPQNPKHRQHLAAPAHQSRCQQNSSPGLEKLDPQGMTASATGAVENSGSNVKAESGLNSSIPSTGWAEVERMLNDRTGVTVAIRMHRLRTRGECRCEHSF